MNPLILGPVFDIIKQVLSGLGIDPAAKERAQNQAFDLLINGTFAEKADQALALAQIDVNKTEAASDSIFKGGWRPFIGWICGSALALQFVVAPIAQWGAAVVGHPIPALPSLDAMLWELVFAMLGLGGLRTVEKLKGKA